MSATDPTTTLPPARRPGRAAWAQLLLAEARSVARDTSGLLVPIGLPVLILAMNGLSEDGSQVLPNGATVMDAFVVPLALTMVVALVGVVNMPSFLAAYRRYGILRRLAVTPVRPVMVLVAQMAVSLAQVLLGVALALALGAAVFGVGAPASPGWALLVGALVLLAMYGVGVLIAAVAPTVNAAVALGLVAFFLMLAVGGAFGPMERLPDVLGLVGERLPFGAGTLALSAAWVGERPQDLHLVVLGGWGVVTGGLAARLFRWT